MSLDLLQKEHRYDTNFILSLLATALEELEAEYQTIHAASQISIDALKRRVHNVRGIAGALFAVEIHVSLSHLEEQLKAGGELQHQQREHALMNIQQLQAIATSYYEQINAKAT